MALVAIVPFIAWSPLSSSNAYAPGPLPDAHFRSISERGIPTFIASQSDPDDAFQYTGASVSLQYATGGGGGGHEIYTYLEINSSQSAQVPGNAVGKSSFSLPVPADTFYWYSTNGGSVNYGTVGADVQVSAGVPTVDQYINPNYAGQLGQGKTPSSAHCNSDPENAYPPSVDTGGEERWGMIVVVTNPSQSVAYDVTGGMILYTSGGAAEMVILVNTAQAVPLSFASYCSDPVVKFSSNVLDWTVRAPPPGNTVSGNYELYQTIGARLTKNPGSASLISEQFVNPSTSTSTTTTVITSTTTTTSTSTTSTSTATSSSSTTTSASSASSTTTRTMTSESTTTTCTTQQLCENPYWNENSQEVANYVANDLFNPQVGLIATSALQGCVDYVGGLPCKDTFWTTSDNVPAGWTLQDFGYASVTQAIIKECSYLRCLSANSGDRYEAYLGVPIAVGSPGDIHGIFSPGSDTIALTCSTSGCGDATAAYGTLSGGTPYKIQADVYSGSAGGSSPNGPVDVVGPQAINYYIRGDMTDSMRYANALVALWNGYSVDGSGGGATWHLGQVMFVMRVLGLDTSNATITTAYGTETYSEVFQQMESELWAIQSAFNCSGGCMPNSYTQSSPGGPIVGTGGVDAENQDAALLPFSYTVVSMVRAEYGTYSMPGGSTAHVYGHESPEIMMSSLSALAAALASLSLSVSAAVYCGLERALPEMNSRLAAFRDLGCRL